MKKLSADSDLMAGCKSVKNFNDSLQSHGITLNRPSVTTVQVNVGKLCNQACLHCHVEAGPKRTEIIPSEVVDRIIVLLENSPSVKTLDITGGAPELVPDFRRLADAGHRLGLEVIDRCNLTVLFEEGQEDLADFLSERNVTIVASLPCYAEDNVDKQRGRGTFDKSIKALQKFNELGYASAEHPEKKLFLVYNPLGASLPPAQAELEATYRDHLQKHFGITFTGLFALANLPIARFLHQLRRDGELEEYMTLLANSFNPHAASEVMCRSMVSVGWQGGLYDCDFNQMLEMYLPYTSEAQAEEGKPTIFSVESFDELANTEIAIGDHCFGCTAGAGSSCGGSLAA